MTTLYDSCDGTRLLAPNDLVFDRDGGFWFTDYGTSDSGGARFGAIRYARADGALIRRAGRLPTPNGIGLSPDGRTLYVTDTQTGRLWACDVAGLPGYQLIDSLAVEADGRFCVGTLINGGITVCTPATGAVEHVPLPDPLITNIAFGGPDLQDAWITASSSGRLYKVRWPRAGLALAFGIGAKKARGAARGPR